MFSVKVDPGEILREYRETRFPNRFYNLKIGIPWADLERKLDLASVLSLCTDRSMLEESRDGYCVMGVDTGKALHVVVIRQDRDDAEHPNRVIHLGIYETFEDLDALMERFQVPRCVIDGLPETHATRAFAQRHSGRVYLSFFNPHQRGSTRWDAKELKVETNRTEALDASRAAIRERRVALPQAVPLVHEFARHLVADAKVPEEDEETGAKQYRYVKTSENHFSLAFTYGWMATPELPQGLRIETAGRRESARAWEAWDGEFSSRRFADLLDRY